MYQISTVSLVPDIQINGSSLHDSITFISIYRSLASWLTLIHVKLTLTYKSLLKLYESFDSLQCNIIYSKNKQPLSTIADTFCVYNYTIDNTLERDRPCNISLYLVNKKYFESYKTGVEFYSEKPVTNQQILSRLFGAKPFRFDPPDKVVTIERPFVPYMSRIKALAYACRYFSYSNTMYFGYVDYDKFKLVNWSYSKTQRKTYSISFMPNQSQAKEWLIDTLYIINRQDYTRRFEGVTQVIETQSNTQPMAIVGESNIASLSSTSYPTNSIYVGLLESHQLYIKCIPFEDPFSIDLLDPIIMSTDVAEYQPYTGYYMITDYILSCDLSQSTFVPYLTLKASKEVMVNE